MLPTLVRLRPVVATGANEEDPAPPDLSLPDLPGLPPLPRELWQKILEAMGTGNGRYDVEKLCEIAGPWAELCRNGTIYDMANIARGYYGRQKTWDAVLAMYKALGVSPPGDGTPKAYFQLAGGAPFHQGQIGQVPHWHPFYEGELFKYVNHMTMGGSDRHPRVQLKDIPSFLSNYAALARLIIMAKPSNVRAVPLNHPAYVELNILALRNVNEYNNLSMRHVPEDHPDFLKILKVALRLYGRDALSYVEAYRNMFPDKKEEFESLQAIAERHYQRKHHASWNRTRDERYQRRPMRPNRQQRAVLSGGQPLSSDSDDDFWDEWVGEYSGPNPYSNPPTSDADDDDDDLSQEEWNAAYNRMIERLERI
tara:strand:+ start:59 stop:1159 length:1101 start_codon:yes stop_codon:yes gene_type:complete